MDSHWDSGVELDTIRDSQFDTASLLKPPSSASVSPSKGRSTQPGILWRGMKNMRATEEMLMHGGCELGPTSCNADLAVALRYGLTPLSRQERVTEHNELNNERCLLFRILIEDFMSMAPDLSFLSAFPQESEHLYPPLTYFKPLGRPRRLKWRNTEITIVDVRPTFPS